MKSDIVALLRAMVFVLGFCCGGATWAVAARPDIWFAPTDNITQHGKDLPQLFDDPDSWPYGASQISVLSFPARYLLLAPAAEVRRQLAWIRAKGIKLAVQLPALPVNKRVCGNGIEGMTWPGEAAHSAKALRALGAEVDFFALDLPMTNGHISKRAQACRLSLLETAARLASAVRELRRVYPDVRIVDLEVPTGIPLSEWTSTLAAWLNAYRAASGEDFYGLTMDAWWKFEWREAAKATASILSARGIRTGIYIDAVEGNTVAARGWIRAARRNACELRALSTAIDYVVIANWMDMNVHNAPESDPNTLTGLLAWFARPGGCSS
ncbi:MAG: hypothetical protein J0I21_09270 [Alphaproteobacteria bacterium]|nr:hypothetical protein [Alphaproteobacteria bacterium]